MKLIHTEKHVKNWVHGILRSMSQDNFRPDYVVGITRGGLVPATMISHYLDVPMHALDVSFRDGEMGPESNLWMAEDAFGYVIKEQRSDPDQVSDPQLRKKILIVDDINDSGRTLQWIKEDWASGCMPASTDWDSVWHNSTRFAVLVDNHASDFKGVDYCGMEINKLETPCWVVFPWENWWEN